MENQYLLEIPGPKNIIDLCRLDEIDNALPLEVIRGLLSGNCPDIHIPAGEQEQAWGAAFAGIIEGDALQIGYPVLNINPSGIAPVTAPLVCWSVHYIPVADGGFTLQRTDEPATICEDTAQYLLDNFGLDVTDLAHRTFGKKGITATSLLTLVNEVIQKLGWEAAAQSSLGRFPVFLQPNSLVWSAAIATYATKPIISAAAAKKAKGKIKPQPEATPEAETTTIPQPVVELQPLTLTTSPIPSHLPVSTIPLNYAQELAWQTLIRDGKVMVHGEEGSGKTYTVAATLLNTLVNGGNALVICNQDSPSYHHLQRVINHAGFGDLSITITDFKGDFDKFMLYTRALPEAIKKRHSPNPDDFRQIARKASIARKTIDDKHATLHKPIIDGLPWVELAGYYQTYNRRGNKACLNLRLQPKDFEFTTEEYYQIAAHVSKQKQLLGAVNTLDHPLNNLHDKVFRIEDADDARQKVKQALESMVNTLTALLNRQNLLIEDFNELTRLQYEDHLHHIESRIRNIRSMIQDFTDDFGVEGSAARTGIISVFTRKYKDSKIARAEIYDAYNALIEEQKRTKYFEHNFTKTRSNPEMAQIFESLNGYEASLRIWQQQIPFLLREENKRFSRDSVFQDAGFSKRTYDTSALFAEVIDKINTSGFLTRPYRFDFFPIISQRDVTESALADVHALSNASKDFDAYFAWRSHWISISEPTRKIVEHLFKSHENNWAEIFSSWYFFQCLHRQYNDALPGEGLDIVKLHKDLISIRETINTFIVDKCRQSQKQAIDALRDTNRDAYRQIIGGKSSTRTGTDSPMLDMFSTSGKIICKLCPILVMTPEVAMQFIGDQGELFDLIAFEEADRIPAHFQNLLKASKHFIGTCRKDLQHAPGTIYALLDKAETKTISLPSSGSQIPEIPASEGRQAFIDEVCATLGNYISKDRIETKAMIGHIPVDILIAPENPQHKPIAVFVDGSLANPTPFTSDSILGWQDLLSEKGYTAYDLWSSDWWYNPGKSIRSLVSCILKNNPAPIAVIANSTEPEPTSEETSEPA